VKAVIFDWDGTLADSHAALIAANVAAMAAIGLPFDEELYQRHYTPDWRLLYRRLGVPDDRVDEASVVWEREFAAATPSVLPGARDAVDRLAAAGYPLALVTSGSRRIVGPQLERLGFAALAVRVFGDEQPEQKPDPAPLRRALDALRLADEPRSATYVGDAVEDMEMARAAGVEPIGVLSSFGHANAAALSAAGASRVVPSVAAWADDVLSTAARRAS
jgi:phosphoglycolate phosphatase